MRWKQGRHAGIETVDEESAVRACDYFHNLGVKYVVMTWDPAERSVPTAREER